MPVFVTVLTIVVATVFAFSGGRKLARVPATISDAMHLGVSPANFRAIGAAEVLGAAGMLVGLLWAPLGAVAALALAVLMGGAVVTHIRAHDPARAAAIPAVLATLAVTAGVLQLVAS